MKCCGLFSRIQMYFVSFLSFVLTYIVFLYMYALDKNESEHHYPDLTNQSLPFDQIANVNL